MFPSTAEAVSETLSQVSTALTRYARTPDPGDMWELALAEVLNNIVEHAYRGQADGEIHVDMDFGRSKLRVKTLDFGHPMPNGKPPEGAPVDLDVPVMDLPEGGFGWFLIRELADRLEYQREDGANKFDLEMPFSGTVPPAP